MVATFPMNRFDSPPVKIPDLPSSARELGQLWNESVVALKNQLTH